jgi:hypothetical protein
MRENELQRDSTPFQLVTSDELGQVIKKSGRTVRRMAKSRIIPSYRVNGDLRFSVAEVIAALQRFRVKELSL